MGVGATLQQGREARELTREQLASRTRIPLRIILAMEQDEWAKVPAGIFARGYLRAYASEVGLDGTQLAAQFDAEHAPPQAPGDPAVEPPPGLARALLRVRWPGLSESARWRLAGPAFAALLVLVYLAGRFSSGAGPTAEPPGSPAPVGVAATGSSTEQAHPVATSSRAGPAAAVADVPPGGRQVAVETPLVVDVEVTRACWVTASADATRVIYRLLQPGERVQARGHVLTLRVGDAGALRLSLDGEPAKPLGASGEVVSVRITRENYRSLLLPRAGP